MDPSTSALVIKKCCVSGMPTKLQASRECVIKSGRVSSFWRDVFSEPKVGQNSGHHFPVRVMSSPLIITKNGAQLSLSATLRIRPESVSQEGV